MITRIKSAVHLLIILIYTSETCLGRSLDDSTTGDGITSAGEEDGGFQLFSFSEEPSDQLITRSQRSCILNCAVKADPKLSLSIVWFKDGQKLDSSSTRRFLSNGSLLLEEGDVTEGTYHCSVTANGLGSILSQPATVRLAYLSKSFLQEPTDLILYLGDVAMIPCSIDGDPAPSVQWMKDGRDLDLHASPNLLVHALSGVLEIRSVQFGDFGRYRCKASNVERSKQSRDMMLSQNSDVGKYKGVPPEFVMRPQSQIVREGAMVLLFCAANGRDQQENRPTVVWLKNGVTVDLSISNSRFSRVGESTLRLDAVEEHDSGVYTCRASNTEECVDEHISLSVLVPPKLRLRPRNTAVVQGSDVDLPCDMYASPAPEVTWLRDGARVRYEGGVQVVDGQTLRILGVQGKDAGVYQCVGNNSVGSMQTTAQLSVDSTGLMKKVIDGAPSQPLDLSAPIVSMHFVTLSWHKPRSAGASEILGYMVTWQSQETARYRAMNVTTMEANIQHLKPATRYTFNVSAYNRHGASFPPVQLLIETHTEEEVPESPTNLLCEVLSPTSIQIKWDAPWTLARTGAPLTGYKIYYYAVVDVIAEREMTIDVTQHYVFTDLVPYSQYGFRVVGLNVNGAGAGTEEVLCRTYSDAPALAPQNVSTETLSSTSVIVRWDGLPKEQHNGILTGYKIRYRPGRDKDGLMVAVTDASTTYCSLNDLSRGVEYSIRVHAVSLNGSGPASPWVTATTFLHDLDESRVPDEPSSFHVRPYTNSIVVSWTPPLNSDVRIRGYILGYGVGIPDVYRKVLDAQQRYYTIKGLTPSSEYVLSLKAFNGAGEGNPAYETTITREEPTPEPLTPIIPPVGLKAIVLSSTTIVLTWSDLHLGKNQRVADNRYYTIRYYPLNASRKQKLLNSTDLNIHIDDLRPDTEYEFSVKVTKGRRQSTWSLSVLNRTMEALPSTSPRDVTPASIETRPSWISLSWQPPRQPNGQITGYLVFYTTDATQKDRDWVVEGVLGDRLSVTIKDLSLETTYYFKVQARNSVGNGPTSPTVIFRTPRVDGSGGGVIEMPDDYGRSYMNPAGPGWLDGPRGSTEATKPANPPTTVLWISIGCISGVTVIAVIIIVAILCRRRLAQKSHRHKGYVAANKNKPAVQELNTPDLWIHDRMEMRQREAGLNEEGVSMMRDAVDDSEAGSERDDDRYRRVPLQPHRPKPVMIPVDQLPPPNYVAAISNGHISPVGSNPLSAVRPVYPRTQYTSQYTTAPRVNASELTHLPSSGSRPATNHHAQVLGSSHMRPPLSPASSTSSSSTRPPTSNTAANHVSEPSPAIRKTESTEELTAEMANLEGLMKDLSVITQQEFEC